MEGFQMIARFGPNKASTPTSGPAEMDHGPRTGGSLERGAGSAREKPDKLKTDKLKTETLKR